MSAVAICADSSCLLVAADAERLGIDVLPVAVTLDGEPFDERTSSLDDFYERLAAGATATTSQPTPADFAAAFERAAAGGAHEVVSIHLDARTSGTVASATLAAAEAPIPVTVVDTGTVSYGVGVCVRAAAEHAASQLPVPEVAQEARRLGQELRNVFVARHGPGGRVPAGPEWAVLEFADGATSVLGTAGSAAASVEALAGHVLEAERHVVAAVGHAARELVPAADELAARLAGDERVVAVERYRVGSAIGAHTGGESFGVFWWPAPAG